MDPSSSLLPVAFQIFAVFTILLIGVFAAFMPYLMPKRECFAVTIPESAQSDPIIKLFKRRYASILLGLTIVFSILCALAAFANTPAQAVGIMGVSIVVLCVVTYGLMLYFRARVQELKRTRGWSNVGACSSAPVGMFELPKPLSLTWDVLFVPTILLCLFICWAGYSDIPQEIPRHIGMDGHVTSYFEKSPFVACFPALAMMFIDAILVFSHWSMLRSKKFTDPAAPAQSAWAYAMFLRAQTILIVAAGVLCGGVGVTMALSFVGVISIGQSAVVCLALVMIIALASIIVSAVYGQNGSRLIANVAVENGNQKLLRDNDRYWKLGIFYANPEDSALFLPERFGIGWTMNWGRPAAWVILGLLLLFIGGFIVALTLLG